MRQRSFFVTIPLLLGLCAIGGAQSRAFDARIQLTIVDGRTAQPLSGVSVQIDGDSPKVTSDLGGRVVIDHLRPGPHLLKAEKVGYMSARPDRQYLPGSSGLP